MNSFIKGTLGILAFLLIPAIFGGIGAGVFFWVIKPPLDARNILKKGTETTATIIDFNSKVSTKSSSGSSTSTKQYYYLILAFVNSDGEKIEYKTNSIYPEFFIRSAKIEKGGIVKVIYSGSKAVVKGFVPKYETWLWIFPVVFGGIAAVFLAIFVLSYVWKANDSSIKKFGNQATGTYLEQEKFLANPDPNLFSISYSFINDNGETVEVKTRFVYSESEAKKLADMKSFPIIYKGKKAIIMIEKSK